jgi:hypothetical protein
MSIPEIAWIVAIAAVSLQEGTGAVMLHMGQLQFEGAKRLFIATPIAPLIATAIWAYLDKPSLIECWEAAIIVGPATIFLTLETLRWLDRLNKETSDESTA